MIYRQSYQAISAYTLSELDQKVNDLMKDGWRPVSLAVNQSSSISDKYFVGMVIGVEHER